jgi:hypothetical protein
MAITPYIPSPVLVDLPDDPDTNVKLRARRVNVSLPDSPAQPCTMQVELIPYKKLADGSYGPELVGGVFTRHLCPPLVVSPHRLVDTTTGEILATRYAPDGSLRSDADWQADVDRIAADTAIEADYQCGWFCRLMQEGMPVPINAFIRQYILLAYTSGDLR